MINLPQEVLRIKKDLLEHMDHFSELLDVVERLEERITKLEKEEIKKP